jgi:phosphatidylglycerophosphate synthase
MSGFDDWFSNEIIDKFNCIFKNIHPNIITATGIVINIIILVYYKKMTFSVFCALLLVRWLIDCLDGNVARKYNKKSDLGGKLDTISDMMLIYILTFIVFREFNINNWFLIVLLFIVGLVENKYSFIKGDHSRLKTVDKSMSFFTNNTVIFYILFIIIFKAAKNGMSSSKKVR